jgi:hypothetical protein
MSDDDDEVQSYLRAVARQTRQVFAQGCGSYRGGQPVAPPAPAAPVAQQTTAVSSQGVKLPPRKKLRSESPDQAPPPAPPPPPAAVRAATATASPRPPSLLARYFPSALRAPTLSAIQLPSPPLKAAIVARVEQWRARVAVLRSAVRNDADANDCAAAGLGVRQARLVAAYLQAQRKALCIPSDAANLALWHRFLERHGPTQGKAPPACLVVLLDEPESNALMHVVCTKLVRGQRGTDFVAAAAAGGAEDDGSDRNDDEAEAKRGGKLFINDEDDDNQAVEAANDDAPIAVVRINDAPSKFSSDVSQEQQETLRFFRHLMPLQLDHASTAASSTGLGAWFFASATAVDLPVDPDLDRLFNELFRACCKHITVLSEHFKGVDAPLLVRVEQGKADGRTPLSRREYWAMGDVGEEEVMALYTVLVILAKILRQNQNNTVPI